MAIANIAMYAGFAPLDGANDALWAYIRDGLRAAGCDNVPDSLDRSIPYEEAWHRPDLLFAQTCGYPYVRQLRGKVRLVATPVYGYAGCEGASMRSFIMVGKDSRFERLGDLRGARAAINGPESNSGMNLFRRAIAPLSREGRFFASVSVTGGHALSIDAVSNGLFDVAGIDCVTYGHIRRFMPERVAGLRILAETPAGPGLPFITHGSATDRDVALLCGILDATLADAGMAETLDRLGIRGFSALGDADYTVLARYAREAGELGYPELA